MSAGETRLFKFKDRYFGSHVLREPRAKNQQTMAIDPDLPIYNICPGTTNLLPPHAATDAETFPGRSTKGFETRGFSLSCRKENWPRVNKLNTPLLFNCPSAVRIVFCSGRRATEQT